MRTEWINLNKLRNQKLWEDKIKYVNKTLVWHDSIETNYHNILLKFVLIFNLMKVISKSNTKVPLLIVINTTAGFLYHWIVNISSDNRVYNFLFHWIQYVHCKRTRWVHDSKEIIKSERVVKLLRSTFSITLK